MSPEGNLALGFLYVYPYGVKNGKFGRFFGTGDTFMVHGIPTTI